MDKSIEYIGDGVYAHSDGYGGIWLYTNDHKNPTNRVYLEQGALEKCIENKG